MEMRVCLRSRRCRSLGYLVGPGRRGCESLVSALKTLVLNVSLIEITPMVDHKTQTHSRHSSSTDTPVIRFPAHSPETIYLTLRSFLTVSSPGTRLINFCVGLVAGLWGLMLDVEKEVEVLLLGSTSRRRRARRAEMVWRKRRCWSMGSVVVDDIVMTIPDYLWGYVSCVCKDGG